MLDANEQSIKEIIGKLRTIHCNTSWSGMILWLKKYKTELYFKIYFEPKYLSWLRLSLYSLQSWVIRLSPSSPFCRRHPSLVKLAETAAIQNEQLVCKILFTVCVWLYVCRLWTLILFIHQPHCIVINCIKTKISKFIFKI